MKETGPRHRRPVALFVRRFPWACRIDIFKSSWNVDDEQPNFFASYLLLPPNYCPGHTRYLFQKEGILRPLHITTPTSSIVNQVFYSRTYPIFSCFRLSNAVHDILSNRQSRHCIAFHQLVALIPNTILERYHVVVGTGDSWLSQVFLG